MRPSSMANTSTTIEDLHPDLLTRLLRLLDGPALASASCTTTHLRSLSAQADLWRQLCLSTWPSLSDPLLFHLLFSSPNSHRSFFSDAYPFPSLQPGHRVKITGNTQLPRELVSAVDIYHKGIPIFSRVVETETSTPWFDGSPFQIDAVNRKDPPSKPAAATAMMESVISPADLTLSWVIIDPATRRAVNVSSRRPVAVDRHWYTGESLVRFAMVLEDRFLVGVVVACGKETGQIREVSLTVEDIDRVCLNGRESLLILAEVIGGGRWRRVKGEENEAKTRYEEFVRRKTERKDNKARMEGRLDMFCTAVGISIFMAFCLLLVLR